MARRSTPSPAATHFDGPVAFSIESRRFSLINHDKVTFLCHARRRLPAFSHYLWVDFGQAQQSLWFVPRNIDGCRLPVSQALYLGDSKFLRRNAPLAPRDIVAMHGSPVGFNRSRSIAGNATGEIAICGTAFAVPRDHVELHARLYEEFDVIIWDASWIKAPAGKALQCNKDPHADAVDG